jgi:hypothetical protein
MNNNPHNKRFSDMVEQAEIERLIAAENDPKVRLQLMIINRLSLNICDVSLMMGEYGKKLDTHIDNFDIHLKNFETQTAKQESIINKGKGVWLVIPGILGMAQVVVGWMLIAALDEVKILHTYDQLLSERIIKLEQNK